ncbi:MAG: ribonuclease III [Hyphomicrobiaceae bacterium]|nr:ribonuclease III [Hyphomicrobiaceae bacterium]
MARKPAQLTALEKAIGYPFKNRELVEQALTHASVRGGGTPRADNERLEFVGDRVLGLAMAEALSAAYPEAREGELAARFNRMVRGQTCAAVARAIDLGKCLILSESEAESGGRDKETILADAVEALLGAVFIEAGFDKARAVVLRLWADHMDQSPTASRDAKSELQEWAQAQGLALPEYVELSRIGPDHAPRFTAEVRIVGRQRAVGEGLSKRSAEQSAASAMLRREGVWSKSKSD